MANNRLSEGVGKKIVEALKKQSEIEINPISNEESGDNILDQDDFLDDVAITDEMEVFGADEEDIFLQEEPLIIEEAEYFQQEQPFVQSKQYTQPEIQPASQAFSGYQQQSPTMADNFVSELDNFEIPSNVAALKKLIAQLPSGVTRQTGAQIIRQTMEALGISMKSVLQEAQQVQDGLSDSIKECQNTIQDYKKQIVSLEKQSQNHQRQYSALNELISLFIQTGTR